MEFCQSEKGKVELLGKLAASVTPSEKLDEVLVDIAPRKKSRKTTSIPQPTAIADENLLILSS